MAATWVVEKERERLADAARSSWCEADLFDPAAVEAAVAATDELEAVVNLVGGYAEGPRVHETDPEQFDGLMRLNVKPGFLLARAAMPRLIERGGGAFVGVSARAALRPFPGAAGYIASKAAVLALIQALDAEYKHDGIRCNAILPSVIDTPANREAAAGRRLLEVGPAGGRSRRSCASSSPTTRRRRAAPPCPSTGARSRPAPAGRCSFVAPAFCTAPIGAPISGMYRPA